MKLRLFKVDTYKQGQIAGSNFFAGYSSCMKKAAIVGFYCALGFSFGTVMTPHTRLWKIFQVSAKLCDVEREAVRKNF